MAINPYNFRDDDKQQNIGPTSRTFLEEVFDLLSVGQYASVGKLKGVQRLSKEGKPIRAGLASAGFLPTKESIKGVAQGLSILPGWEGFKDPEDHSFSEYLGDSGWNPDSTVGKFAKGAIGFVGDVALDPLTYVSGGAGGVLKGTGKGAGKTLGSKITKEAMQETAEKLSKEGLERASREFSEMGAKGAFKGISRDSAEEIVRHYGRELSEDAIQKQTDDLVKHYGKFGKHASEEGVTLGLQNAPFGKKVFGDSTKPITVLNRTQLEKIGDKTVAPYVNDMVESFYNSKVGKMFSTKTGMRELAMTNPEESYKLMKVMNDAKLAGLDRRATSKLIKESAEEMGIKNWSRYKQDQAIKAFENPQMMKYVDSVTGDEFDNVDDAVKERLSKYTASPVDEFNKVKEAVVDIQSASEGVLDKEITKLGSSIDELVSSPESLDTFKKAFDKGYANGYTSQISKTEQADLLELFTKEGDEGVKKFIDELPKHEKLRYTGFNNLIDSALAREFNIRSASKWYSNAVNEVLELATKDEYTQLLNDLNITPKQLAEGNVNKSQYDFAMRNAKFFEKSDEIFASESLNKIMTNVNQRSAMRKGFFAENADEWLKGNDKQALLSVRKIGQTKRDAILKEYDKIYDDFQSLSKSMKEADVQEGIGYGGEKINNGFESDWVRNPNAKPNYYNATQDELKALEDIAASESVINVGEDILDDVSNISDDMISDVKVKEDSVDLDDIMKNISPRIEGLSVDETKVVQKIKDDWFRMGIEEVDAGLMQEGARRKMQDHYFPRILTNQGKVAEMNEKSVRKSAFQFVDELFGNKKTKTPDFAKSRLYKDASTLDINKRKGFEHFMTDVTDVYIARSIAHDEAFYKANFGKKLMDDLGVDAIDNVTGHVLPKVGDDFKYTVSYNDLVAAINKKAGRSAGQTIKRLQVDDMAKHNSFFDVFNKDVESLSESIGLPLSKSDEWAKPLVELSEEQVDMISNLLEMDSIKQVHGISIDEFNKARNIEIAKRGNQLLNTYDQFLKLYKKNVTSMIPGFHGRNAVSNQFQNFLGVGADITDKALQVDATKVMRNGGVLDKVAFGNTTYSQLWDEGKALGIFDDGFFKADMAEGSDFIKGMQDIDLSEVAQRGAKSVKQTIAESSFNPLKDDFIGYRFGDTAGTFVENRDKVVHYTALRRKGLSPQEAADSVNKFMFDYGDLTQFEHTVMKRVVPFYTWIKKNVGLQAGELVNQPETYRMLAKLINSIDGGVSEDDELERDELPPYAQTWKQLPIKVGGKDLFINPNLPYQDLDKLPEDANVLNYFQELLSLTSPAIKAPIELATNRNLFFDGPVYSGDDKGRDVMDYLLSYFETYSFGKKMRSDYKAPEDKAFDALNRGTGLKLGRF